MTDFYSQNRCVCSTRSHGPLLCAFCLSFHFKRILGGATVAHLPHLRYKVAANWDVLNKMRRSRLDALTDV